MKGDHAHSTEYNILTQALNCAPDPYKPQKAFVGKMVFMVKAGLFKPNNMRGGWDLTHKGRVRHGAIALERATMRRKTVQIASGATQTNRTGKV